MTPNPAHETSVPASAQAAPSRSARRAQMAIDCGAALLLAMLAWPFPLARAALAPLVHVAAIIAFWQAVQVAYFAVTMAVWGATAGTRLMGLKVVAVGGATPSRRQRVVWGVIAGAIALARVAVPSQSGRRDVPERAARCEVVAEESTRG